VKSFQKLTVPAGIFAVVAVGLYAVSAGLHPTKHAADRVLTANVPRTSSTGSSAESDAVESAFMKAMRIDQQLAVPVASSVGAAPNTMTLQKQSAAATERINDMFLPSSAAGELTALHSAITAEQNPQFRVTGGDAKIVKYDKVVVNGSTAVVDAHVETWSRFEHRQSSSGPWIKSEPHNILVVNMTLVKVSGGGWKVSVFHWKFAPGSTP
jgi:hypothetical protein